MYSKDNEYCNERIKEAVKGQRILFVYSLLKENGSVSKNKVMKDLKINELAFWRYMQEIRAFLTNFNMNYELLYDRNDVLYRLIKK